MLKTWGRFGDQNYNAILRDCFDWLSYSYLRLKQWQHQKAELISGGVVLTHIMIKKALERVELALIAQV